jgi:hypothetical protein
MDAALLGIRISGWHSLVLCWSYLNAQVPTEVWDTTFARSDIDGSCCRPQRRRALVLLPVEVY